MSFELNRGGQWANVRSQKFMKLPNPYTQRELADARKVPPQNEPFAAINFSFHETYTRLVGTTLLWQRGPLLIRIEGSLPRARLVAIARSIPVG